MGIQEDREQGKYCMKELLKLAHIDTTSMSSQNDIISNWTPNNVRRVVISPDGLLVNFHIVGYSYKKSCATKVFKRDEAEKCFNNRYYTPMYKALTSGRVCSCIEEIIILTQSENGLMLPNAEKNIPVIAEQHSLYRLYGIGIMNITMSEFINRYGSMLNDKYRLVLEDESTFKIQKKIITRDWWVCYSLRPSYYSMDAEDGKLSKHFNTVKEYRNTLDRKNKVKEIEDKKAKELIDKYRSKLEILDKTLYVALYVGAVLNNKGNVKDSDCEILSDDNFINKFKTNFINIINSEGYNLPSAYKDILSNSTVMALKSYRFVFEDDNTEYNFSESFDYLRKFVVSIYTLLVNLVVSIYSKLNSSYPISCKYILSDITLILKDTVDISNLEGMKIKSGTFSDSCISILEIIYRVYGMDKSLLKRLASKYGIDKSLVNRIINI